jgi:hypothetical protein
MPSLMPLRDELNVVGRSNESANMLGIEVSDGANEGGSC